MAKSATGGSKADTAVKLVLIFFISLFSFTVGTFVGGKFEKNKTHQAALEMEDGGHDAAASEEMADADATPISNEEIAGLEEFVKADAAAADRKVASVEEHAAATADTHAEPTTGKEGYTHASQLKEGTETTEHAAAAPAAHATAPTAHVAPSVKASAAKVANALNGVAPAAERVAKDEAPTPDPKKVREPAKNLPMVASTTIGKFTVQVASYATEKEAEAHATKLKDKGFNAFFIPAVVNGKTWYRVSVGRFEDQKTAMNHRKELLDSQVTTSAIVQKVVQ